MAIKQLSLTKYGVLGQHKLSDYVLVAAVSSALLLCPPAQAKKHFDPGQAPPGTSAGTSDSDAATSTATPSDQTAGATQSNPLQGGTQSTSLQGGTQSTTLQAGTQSTLLQSSTNSTMLQTGTAGSLIRSGVQEEAGPVNVLFVVDASYSMKEKLGGGEMKMVAAKQVLQDALRRIPPDVNVGMRVFGQGMSSVPEIDCRQSALVVPIETNNRRSIFSEIQQLKPSGMTPLEFSLREAAEDDFRGLQGKKIMILITDGADTCGGNPCEFIKQLPYMGIKIKVDVVGVDLKREPLARAQLHCVADSSGGKYYDANTAAQLIDSVSKSVDTAISGRVIIHQNPSGSGGGVKNPETPPELMPQHPKVDLP